MATSTFTQFLSSDKDSFFFRCMFPGVCFPPWVLPQPTFFLFLFLLLTFEPQVDPRKSRQVKFHEEAGQGQHFESLALRRPHMAMTDSLHIR